MAQLAPRRIETVAFDGSPDSFPSWTRSFRALMTLHGYGDVLTEANVANIDAAQNAAVFNYLLLSIKSEDLSNVGPVNDADGRALWDALHAEYAPNTAVYLQALQQELNAVEYPGSLKKFLATIEKIRDKIRVTGADVDDYNAQLCARVTLLLPEDLKRTAFPFVTSDDADTRANWPALSRALREHSQFLNAMRGPRESALAVQTPSPVHHRPPLRSSRPKPPRDRADVECYFC